MGLKNKSILKAIFFFWLIVLLVSCAQVVAPTGGPKDVSPPVILKQSPESNSLNFTANGFTLSFDEYVQLRNLKDELIVSPPLKYAIDTRIKGKNLEVEWEDTLKENTTYLFNFGSSLVDVAEANPIVDYKYVFSTGAEIDTAYLEGKVIDAFEKSPVKGALVQLYADYSDSIPLKEVPTYLARTNASGAYRIDNIKIGRYKAFVLEDANKNYLFDRPDEKIAFSNDLITISDSVNRLDFRAFQEDFEKQYVDKTIEEEAKSTLLFNRSYDSLQITGIGFDISNNTNWIEYLPNSDTAIIWWNKDLDTTLQIEVFDYKNLRDTLSIKVGMLKSKLKSKWDRRQAYFESPIIEWNRPISNIDTNKILLLNKDSLPQAFQIQLAYKPNLLKVLANFQEDSSYQLILLPEAITDLYGQQNDSTVIDFKFDNERDYGSLSIQVEDSLIGAKLLQLYLGKDKLIREVKLLANSYTFEHLKAGDYSMKLIYDQNNNGAWDTGNYLEGIQAERVVLFKESITIRSNWDKELKWIITKDNE